MSDWREVPSSWERIDGVGGAVTSSTALTDGAVLVGVDSAGVASGSGLGFSEATTPVLSTVTATALGTPSAPTVTPETPGGGVTWTYKVVAKLQNGAYTAGGSAGSTADGAADLTAASSANVVTWSAVTGAYQYDVYRTVTGTTPATTGKIGTTTGLSLTDNGLAGNSASVPSSGTTGLVATPALKVTTSPSAGYVLTSDASGNATWQAAGGLSGGSAGRLAIWSGASIVTSNAATMADPTTGVVTLGPPATDVTMLTARASAAPGTAHIAQFQASDNSPLSHIAHDGKFVGNVTGTASGNPTNSAGANVVPKSDGTNLVASTITDNGTTLTLGNAGVTVTEATGAVGLTAQAVGTTPLALTGATGQTASLLTVTGGATPGASYSPAVSITQTLPASPSAAVFGASIIATGAGSNAYRCGSLYASLEDGYQGGEYSSALWLYNKTTAGSGDKTALYAYTRNALTGGSAYGVVATGGNRNYGSIGVGVIGLGAEGNKRVGVLGAITESASGSNPSTIGGYFTNQHFPAYATGLVAPAVPASTNAALVADNATVANAVFLAMDNSTTVFSVEDGGYLTGAQGGSAGTVAWGVPAASPQAYAHTMSASSRGGTDTNTAGASATIRAGLGTGTGGSGSLILQAAPVDATGTAANTPQAVATFAAGATTITTTTPTAVAATTAGNSVTIAASNATAGLSSAGAATGGSVNITAGNAARYTSGNANGGNIYLTAGAGIGTGTSGTVVINDGTSTFPSLRGSDANTGFAFPSSGSAAVWVYNGTDGGRWNAGNGIGLNSTGRYGIASGTDSSGLDTFWMRKAAANPRWGTTAATPVAYVHTLSGESRGGTDTDVQGAAAILQPGTGTGTGGSGTLKAQTAYPGATGTTANTYSDREVFAPKWTTLTESSATAIATLTFGASSVVGAEFLVTIESNDGTDYQALTSRVRVSSVRKATGNTVSTVALVGTDLLAESTGTSTLTATYTLTEGASAVTLNVNAVSSLTQTILRATFQAVSNGPACTIAQS